VDALPRRHRRRRRRRYPPQQRRFLVPLNGDGLGVGAPGVGEVGPEARRPRRSSLVPLPFAPPQAPVYRPISFVTDRRALAGKQVQAALLLNYDPSGPSRLLPVM